MLVKIVVTGQRPHRTITAPMDGERISMVASLAAGDWGAEKTSVKTGAKKKRGLQRQFR